MRLSLQKDEVIWNEAPTARGERRGPRMVHGPAQRSLSEKRVSKGGNEQGSRV